MKVIIIAIILCFYCFLRSQYLYCIKYTCQIMSLVFCHPLLLDIFVKIYFCGNQDHFYKLLLSHLLRSLLNNFQMVEYCFFEPFIYTFFFHPSFFFIIIPLLLFLFLLILTISILFISEICFCCQIILHIHF